VESVVTGVVVGAGCNDGTGVKSVEGMDWRRGSGAGSEKMGWEVVAMGLVGARNSEGSGISNDSEGFVDFNEEEVVEGILLLFVADFTGLLIFI
jgi:hypothetical protein